MIPKILNLASYISPYIYIYISYIVGSQLIRL